MGVMKLAIVGCGIRATRFCEYARKNPSQCEIAYVIDKNFQKAKLFNDYYKLKATIGNDIEIALSDNDLEAVIVATTDCQHVEPTVAALKFGKHIYIEKPLATTLEDCDQILNAAKTSKSLCYLGFNLRHNPVLEKVHQLTVQGKVGKITTIEANEWYYEGKTYFRRWNRLREYSGGLWLTKACHDFDYISWLSGGQATKVYATSNLSYYKPMPEAGPRCRDCKIKTTCADYYDISQPCTVEFDEIWRQLQLRMEQDGELAPDVCLYNSEKDTFDNGIAVLDFNNDVRATYTVNVLASKTTRQVKVIGTEGMIEADLATGTVVNIKRHTGTMVEFDLTREMTSSHGGADDKIFADFLRVCRGGGIPRSGLMDGKNAVKISLAATQSSDSGMPVKIF